MGANMDKFSAFTKNSISFSVLLGIFAVSVAVIGEVNSDEFAVIFGSVIIWIVFVFRSVAPINKLEPMILPACFLVTSLCSFSIFSFSEAFISDAMALVSVAMIILSLCFAFYRVTLIR